MHISLSQLDKMNINLEIAVGANTTENTAGTGTHGCTLFPGEDDKCVVLKYCKLVSSTLSIAGSLFTIAIVIFFKKYKAFTQRMIANLSMASMLVGIGYIIDEFEDEATIFCKFQAALLTYSLWCILLWIVCILANLYRRIITGLDWRRKEIVITTMCWTIPLVFMTIPFVGDAYGPAGLWCWIMNSVGWRFGIWYIWDMLSIVVFFGVMIHVVYVLLKITRSKRSSNGVLHLQTLHEDIRILRLYPVVYFIVHLFPIIHRIEDAMHGYSFATMLLHTLTGPFVGAAVAIVFVLDKNTTKLLNRKGIRKAIQNWKKPKTEINVYQCGREFGPAVVLPEIEVHV